MSDKDFDKQKWFLKEAVPQLTEIMTRAADEGISFMFAAHVGDTGDGVKLAIGAALNPNRECPPMAAALEALDAGGSAKEEHRKIVKRALNRMKGVSTQSMQMSPDEFLKDVLNKSGSK